MSIEVDFQGLSLGVPRFLSDDEKTLARLVINSNAFAKTPGTMSGQKGTGNHNKSYTAIKKNIKDMVNTMQNIWSNLHDGPGNFTQTNVDQLIRDELQQTYGFSSEQDSNGHSESVSDGRFLPEASPNSSDELSQGSRFSNLRTLTDRILSGSERTRTASFQSDGSSPRPLLRRAPFPKLTTAELVRRKREEMRRKERRREETNSLVEPLMSRDELEEGEIPPEAETDIETRRYNY